MTSPADPNVVRLAAVFVNRFDSDPVFHMTHEEIEAQLEGCSRAIDPKEYYSTVGFAMKAAGKERPQYTDTETGQVISGLSMGNDWNHGYMALTEQQRVERQVRLRDRIERKQFEMAEEWRELASLETDEYLSLTYEQHADVASFQARQLESQKIQHRKAYGVKSKRERLMKENRNLKARLKRRNQKELETQSD